jgi:hypothetical protein
VRREGVTEAAANLQRAGLIRYRRGHITVLDREGLEQRTCECYAVVRKEYDRLLPVATSRLRTALDGMTRRDRPERWPDAPGCPTVACHASRRTTCPYAPHR